MAFKILYADGSEIDAVTLEQAQQIAEKSLLLAAAGETSTYYEPVEIVEIREGIYGDTFAYARELGFDPVIQPEEPACLGGGDHNWENDENMRNHGGGHTWSRTCLNCGLIEYHDSWHDNGYGGTLYWIAYEFPVISELGMADKFGVIR